MRKTILTILGSALLAASLTQAAAAAEHHKARKIVRAPASASQQFRNSNDYYAPAAPTFAPVAPWAQPGWSGSSFEDEAMSPPAGH